MPDVTAPLVTNYSPTAGSQITPTTALAFDVTDETGLFHAIMITVSFPDGSWEVVHTGAQFAPFYAAGSGRAVIALGFRYTLRRAGGWPAHPTIISFAVDAGGNESA